MKYIQEIINPSYSELVELFDQRFERAINNQSEFGYKTMLRLKVNLKAETTIDFPMQLIVKEKGKKTHIVSNVSLVKIYVLSFIIFGLISVIRYYIQPDLYALIFGVISGLITYVLARRQVKKELEKYFSDLFRKT